MEDDYDLKLRWLRRMRSYFVAALTQFEEAGADEMCLKHRERGSCRATQSLSDTCTQLAVRLAFRLQTYLADNKKTNVDTLCKEPQFVWPFWRLLPHMRTSGQFECNNRVEQNELNTLNHTDMEYRTDIAVFFKPANEKTYKAMRFNVSVGVHVQLM